MCRSMVDIQSPTAEIRRGKKKKEEETGWKYIWSTLLHRATIKKLILLSCHAPWWMVKVTPFGEILENGKQYQWNTEKAHLWTIAVLTVYYLCIYLVLLRYPKPTPKPRFLQKTSIAETPTGFFPPYVRKLLWKMVRTVNYLMNVYSVL